MLSDASLGLVWSFSLGSGGYREAATDQPLRFRGWAVRDRYCIDVGFFTACLARISPEVIWPYLIASLLAGGGVVLIYRWRRRRNG